MVCSNQHFGESHFLGNLALHIPVAAGLAEWSHRGPVEMNMPVPGGFDDIIDFELGGGWQDDVGKAGGVGHELLVNHGEEIVAQKAADHIGCIGSRGRWIRNEDIERHDGRIGSLSRENGAQSVHIDHTRLRWAIGELAHGLAVPDNLATLGIERARALLAVVTRHGRQCEQSADGLATILRSLDTVVEFDQWFPGVHPPLGELDDERLMQTGDASNAVDRVAGGTLAQVPPADGVLLQKFLVVAISLEDAD